MNSNEALSIMNLSCGYPSHKGEVQNDIITDFSIDIYPGEILCILGKNGIGKTTLFKTLFGSLSPISGEVSLAGKDLFSLSRRDKASLVAYVPQSHNPPFAYTAFEIVLMGRAGLISPIAVPSANDELLAEEAMQTLGIEHLATRAYTKISGGERQMVLIARAIAQGAKYLFLDEPAANLDFGNQMKVLRVLKDLADSGRGVVFTSHDPSHALLLNSKVVAIRSKNEFSIGLAEEIITEEMAEGLYGIRSEIVEIFDNERGENVRVFAPFLQ